MLRLWMMKETGKISAADRHAATAAYLAGPRPVMVVDWSLCQCSQYQHPHPPHRSEKSVFDYHRSLSYISIFVKDKKHEVQRKNKPRARR